MGAKYFGAAVKRREDPRFLRGEARYVDDVKLPGMLQAAFLRAHHAHARIAGLRTRAAAAHEINNPLAIVMGSLDLLARRLAEDSQETRLIEQALGGVRRIRDIVVRMTHITRVESTPPEGNLPPILDIKKSTAGPEQEVS